MSDGEKIRVMLVDDIVDTREQLEKLLFFENDIEVIAKAGNGLEAVQLARQHHPHVVLMDINMPDMDGIAATEAILKDDPNIQVIIMSVQGETDYLRRAMLAGAREFLTKPISSDDLYKSIRHVYRLAQSRPRAAAVSSGTPSTSDTGGSSTRGEVIAVFSPKGGVGTSVIAANLAVAIRQTTNKKVAMVDGNVTFGDLSVILNLISNKTIVDITQRIDNLDRELLNDVLATHNSQVKVLLAAPDPQSGELVTADHLRAVLEVMRQEFDYVIVDTQASFSERTLAALDIANRIVTLLTLEVSCIRNVSRFLEVADMLQYDQDKIMLVLNKADARLRFSAANVEEFIKRKLAVQIGYAYPEMPVSINNGVPLIIEQPNHRTSKDIMTLARELTATDKAAPAPSAAKDDKGGGFFNRLRNR